MMSRKEQSQPATHENMVEVRDKTARWLGADPTISDRARSLASAVQSLFTPTGGHINYPDLILTCAPGRAEILGNQTDGHKGLTLSANITPNLLMVGRPRRDNIVRVASLDQEGSVVEFTTKSADDIVRQKAKPGEDPWADYAKGVLWSFMEKGKPVTGFDAVIQSTIPVGAGVSSSAAIELAIAHFVETATSQQLSPMERVQLSKSAENDYVGVPCGYLDQATVALSDGEMLQIDYRPSDGQPFTHQDVEVDLAQLGYIFVIGYDPKSQHALTDGKYAERKKACLDSLPTLQRLLPDIEINALRDISPGNLQRVATAFQELKGEKALDYVTHIVDDNERVLFGKKVLEAGYVQTFGKLMTESGKSSIDLYGVAEDAEELQFVYNTVLDKKVYWGVAGIRNMGGGFNATTLALVRTEAVDDYKRGLEKEYKDEYGREYQFISSTPAPSSGELDILTVLSAKNPANR